MTMDAQGQKRFRDFVENRSSALLKTAVLLSGGDRHAAEDLLQNALIKAAGRWQRIDEPEAYVRQILYRQHGFPDSLSFLMKASAPGIGTPS